MNSKIKQNKNKVTLERKRLNCFGTLGKAILSSWTKSTANFEVTQLGLF